MSSRDGYARADIDTNLYHDPKVLALHRRLRDHRRTSDAMTVYTATVLASWKANQRLTIAESAPAWWLDDPEALVPDLQAVGLLDAEGRVAEHAFTAWTDRARSASEQGQKAALARWKRPPGDAPAMPDDAPAMLEQSSRNAQPDSRPAGPPAGTAARLSPSPAGARDGAVSRDPTTTTTDAVVDDRSFTEKVFGAWSPAGTEDAPATTEDAR